MNTIALIHIIMNELEKRQEIESQLNQFKNVSNIKIYALLQNEKQLKLNELKDLYYMQLLHQLLHDSFLLNLIWLNRKVKKVLEMNGYTIDSLTKDTIMFIFKYFDCVKMMDKNEKLKMKQIQQNFKQNQNLIQLSKQF
jgi:translation elongation factor EF-1beta